VWCVFEMEKEERNEQNAKAKHIIALYVVCIRAVVSHFFIFNQMIAACYAKKCISSPFLSQEKQNMHYTGPTRLFCPLSTI